MPNLCCLDITKQILSLFWGVILGQEIPNLPDPYNYTVLLYCMIIIAIAYIPISPLGPLIPGSPWSPLSPLTPSAP